MALTSDPPRNGFTLIELSIVLVIIGLVLGGVVAGKDLIKAAEIRAQVKQLMQFSAASNAFYSKYHFLAGDMPTSAAQSFGLPYAGSWVNAFPNGDGIIVGDDNVLGDPPLYGSFTQEPMWFFPQLAGAAFIPGSYTPCIFTCADGSTIRKVGIDYPALALDPNVGVLPFTPYAVDGATWLILSIGNDLASNLPWNWQMSRVPTMTPSTAYQLDSKMDDGVPATGGIRAYQMKWNNAGDEVWSIDKLTGDYAGNCVTSAAGTTYNLTLVTRECRIGYKL